MNVLSVINRKNNIFLRDLENYKEHMKNMVEEGRFLIIGGAGSIGQEVAKEIFKRNPKSLHVVDISENNLVELVRDIRSTLGYSVGDFRTFAVDCGSKEFQYLVEYHGPYDYIFNLSALKHVRSEKDPFTLMRMIRVNILNTLLTVDLARKIGARKYFCVSTDKAANPINMMGASKRIMEMLMLREGLSQSISMARFANVAFSDGSLLHGFRQRVMKNQPISAPSDVRRYFITPQESGELCLLSGLIGENRDIFFPKLSEELTLINFSDIARRYLLSIDYEPYECSTEDEARFRAVELIKKRKWPCYFFKTDTSGEKDFEEFFTQNEELDLDKFFSVGVIKNSLKYDEAAMKLFINSINELIRLGNWDKSNLIKLFQEVLPNFAHNDTGKYLDQRM